MTENDPTAVDPEETGEEGAKPNKPDLPEADLPEEGDDVSDVEEIEVPEEDFMSPEEAAADDTVDNEELDLGGGEPAAD